MLRTLWDLTRGYRFTPWRSPYLRWRIETYSGLDAEHIGFREFWSFAWRERHHLWCYLQWTNHMRKRQLLASNHALHGD